MPAQIGEAQQCVDEVIVGGELQRIDACFAERGAQFDLARARQLREALAEPAIVRVHEHLLARLGVLDHEETQVGQLHLQLIIEAHCDDLVTLGEMRERLGPAGRTDEIGDHEHERAPRHCLER
ncbi:MAG: hypothetical protein H6R20_1748 [Proteobacteria bacterium]|nr:hypothetical protein [Pseudomonadota bacterium]